VLQKNTPPQDPKSKFTWNQFPTPLISVAMGITIFLFVGLGWHTWQSYRYFAQTNASNFRMETLVGTLTHLNEVLTMSARMAAQTGDTEWIDRYHTYEPQLDKSIKELAALTPDTFHHIVTQIDSANTALVNIDNQAFDLIRQNQETLAIQLLNSEQYETHKNLYASSLQQVFDAIHTQIDEQLAEEKRRILLTDLGLLTAIPILIIIWFSVIRSTKKYLHDRNLVQTELLLKDRALASASNGIVISDATLPDNPLIYCNDAFTKITGYEAHEVLNQNCRFLQRDDTQQEALDELRQAIKDERETQVILRNYKKDSTLFWNRLILSPIRDSNNHVTHFIGIQEDITQSKQNELELHDAKASAEQNAQKLSQTLLSSESLRKEADEARARAEVLTQDAQSANQAKSDFLANMSHEMRTPLNAILGFTEILDRLIAQPDQREYLNYVQTSGKSLLTLINDILDLAKIKAGKLELNYKAINIQKIFEEISQVFKEQTHTKKLEFIVETAPNIPSSLWLDETRLRQILINLIGNAVKFTQKGHILLVASCQNTSSERSHTDFIIDVTDSGIGIPEEDQARIFGAFEQVTQEDAPNVGTGLGLAITRRLVEAMRGYISFHSKEGQGTTFRVTFKNVKISEDTPLSNTRQTLRNTQFAPNNILVVDDVQSNRELLSRTLEACGLTVFEAANGTEALQMAEKHLPSIMLIDIRMPGMDGFELATRIHQNPKLTHIPLIAITASAMKDNESQIHNMFDGYMAKPVDLQILISQLSRYLPHQTETPQPASETNTSNTQIDPILSSALEALQGTWENLQNALVIDDVEKFATQIEKLGEKHQATQIQNWGKQLNQQIESFDLDGIRQTLESFPDLIKRPK